MPRQERAAGHGEPAGQRDREANLASEDRGRARLIEHYLRFVLHEEGGPIRERLQRALVELALKTGNPNHAMTARDAQVRIIQDAQLPDYPMGLVAQGINQLVQRGDVQTLDGAVGKPRRYRLNSARFEAVDQALAQTEAQERRFRECIVRRMEERLGELAPHDAKLVGSAFAGFVGRMLETLGERCAHRLIEERSGQQVTYPTIHDDLDAAVRGLPVDLQEVASSAFEEALRHPSPEEATYLYTAGQVYYVAELLDIDPSLQGLQRGRFENTVLFLDTNLLLPLVHSQHEAHEAVRNLVSLCASAGFKLVYSERTAEEFDSLITAASQEFRKAPQFDFEAAAVFAEVVDNPILRGWLESYSDHRASWSQYRARIVAWRGLLSEQGVEVFSLRPVDHGNARYQRLTRVFANERKSPKKTGRGSKRRRRKRPLAVDHDAELVTSIEGLVSDDDSSPDPFGPRYWVITRDRHLVDCARSESELPVGSVVMLAEEWIQYIAPFLGSDTSGLDPATTFAGLLSSRFIPSLGERMTLTDLRLFTQPQVAALTADLSQEDACRAISIAHLEAVSHSGNHPRDDAYAVNQLAELAEKQIARRKRRGEVVPAEIFRRLQEEREKEARRSSEASEERNRLILNLKNELARTRADQRLSISYWTRKFKAKLVQTVQKARAWARGHPWRAAGLIAVLLLVLAIQLFGLGGLFAQITSPLLIVLAVLGVNFGAVRSNIAGLLGLKPRN